MPLLLFQPPEMSAASGATSPSPVPVASLPENDPPLRMGLRSRHSNYHEPLPILIGQLKTGKTFHRSIAWSTMSSHNKRIKARVVPPASHARLLNWTDL